MQKDGNNLRESRSECVGERVRIFQRGRVWQAQFIQDGKLSRMSLRTSNKKVARNRAVALEHQLAEGEVRTRHRAPSLTDVIDEYLQHLRTERRSPKTIDKCELVFRRLLALADELNVKTIAQVNVRVVDRYRRQQVDASRAPKTVHHHTVAIRQLVNFALRRELIRDDPLKHLKIVKPKPRPQPCWTPDEVERILASTEGAYQSALTFLAETGMRIGELKFLTWQDVDLENNLVHIRPKDGWQPKTGDQRTVPLSKRGQAVLQSMPRSNRWVFGMRLRKATRSDDQQLSERRLLDYLKRRLKKLGLPGHLHTFRHSFISKALLAGIPEPIVREWVGHVDPAIIRQYTHVRLSESQIAMAKLSKQALVDEQREECNEPGDIDPTVMGR